MVSNLDAWATKMQFSGVYINLLSNDCFCMLTRNEKENILKLLKIVYLIGLMLDKISYPIFSKNVNRGLKKIVKKEEKVLINCTGYIAQQLKKNNMISKQYQLPARSYRDSSSVPCISLIIYIIDVT